MPNLGHYQNFAYPCAEISHCYFAKEKVGPPVARAILWGGLSVIEAGFREISYHSWQQIDVVDITKWEENFLATPRIRDSKAEQAIPTLPRIITERQAVIMALQVGALIENVPVPWMTSGLIADP